LETFQYGDNCIEERWREEEVKTHGQVYKLQGVYLVLEAQVTIFRVSWFCRKVVGLEIQKMP